MSAAKAQRVAVLDGLRAMAIILVLMRHGVRPFWLDLEAPFLSLGGVEFGSIFINGWMGVDLFFVLSGYLITSHLLGRYFNPEKGTMDLKIYAKRRFLRIAPAYYAALTLAVLGLFPFYPYPESYDHIGWQYLYHLLFLQDYLPSDIVAVFWSLAVELKFYLLAPFVLMALLRMRSAGGRVAALAAVFALLPLLRYLSGIVYSGGERGYELYFEEIRSVFHLTLDGLLIGMLCALLHRDRDIREKLEKPAVANSLFTVGLSLFLGVALFAGPLVDLEVSDFDIVLLPSLIALSFGAMLLGLRGGCWADQFFAWRGWLPVALISYSLYLLHLPLMYPAEVLARFFVDFDAYSPQIKMLVYTPFWILLAGIMATISYYCFEKPFLSKM